MMKCARIAGNSCSYEIGFSVRVELFYVTVHASTVLAATANLTFTLTFSPYTSNRDSIHCHDYIVNHQVLFGGHAIYFL